MSNGTLQSRAGLFARATRQHGFVPTVPLDYDADRQIAVVIEGDVVVPAVEHRPRPQTKKGDIGKGEDQKDRW
jgi:hypothetical protein